MSNLTYEEIVRADAVLDMHSDILKTIIATMKTHGDEEPSKALAMIGASFIMTIEEIDKSFETGNFSAMILELLLQKKRKELQ
jgi:hypothetical protein